MIVRAPESTSCLRPTEPSAPSPGETSTSDPPANSDESLIDQVETAFRSSGYLYLRQLTVSVENGAVVLRGRVPTYFLKQVAQSTVLALEGIAGLTNDVDVICPGLAPAAAPESLHLTQVQP